MTETSEKTFQVGDLVTVDPAYFKGLDGHVFEITVVPRGKGYVNYTAVPQGDPTGRGVKGKGYMFLPYDPDAAPAPIVRAWCPPLGTVVRVNGIGPINPDDLYVVTGEKGADARIVKLGGEGGRYWPTIPAARLTVVPLSEIVA